MISRNKLYPALAILLFFSPAITIAQQFRSSITGRVMDAQEAVVPGVKVKATDTATQAVYESVSGATGQYTLPFLQPGTYRVEAEVAGFKHYIRENIHLSANDQLGLDIVLELGTATES